MRIRGSAMSGGVPGVNVFCTLEAEVEGTASVLSLSRFEPEAHVIAQVEAVQYVADEPAWRVGQDRGSVWTFGPVGQLELVDLVARLAAEQLGEVALGLTQEVDDDRVCGCYDVERAVHLRYAHEEARRVDAALGREADQAAVALAVARDRGDDEHRPVQPGHQLREVAGAQAAKSATRSLTPASTCSRRADIVCISRSAGSLSDRIDALKRLIPRSRASSARSRPIWRPTARPCIGSATVIATSAVSGSSGSRTKRPTATRRSQLSARSAISATWSTPSTSVR